MQSIGLPQKVLQEISRVFYRFIWQKRCATRKAFEKIKRSVMESDYSDGGVRMVIMFTTQNLIYVK